MDDAMRLPAVTAGREVAFPTTGMARPHYLADNPALNDIVDFGGRRVRALTADPPPHIGVEGQVDAPEQHLAVARLQQRTFNECEIVRHWHAVGAPFE